MCPFYRQYNACRLNRRPQHQHCPFKIYNQILRDDKQPIAMHRHALNFVAKRNWLHPCSNDFILCHCSPALGFTPSTGTVDFITRDFHKLKSRQHSQTNRCSLHTLSLTWKTRCYQRISFVDVLLTTQIFLPRRGRFGGHTGWSKVQLTMNKIIMMIMITTLMVISWWRLC